MGGSSKKQTVGYKYHLGLHMILCHGPVDKIVRIRVDEKDAWLGNRKSGAIMINKPDLFGGESREGGIQGQVDFEPGEPTQGINPYLQTVLGGLVPAFRGVCGVVLRRMYVGMNPYLKKWDFRVSRVMVRQDGIPQWYSSTAAIPTARAFGARQRILFCLDTSTSMNTSVGGSATRFTIMKDNMIQVLDELAFLAQDSQVPVDVAITSMNGGGISFTSITQAGINSLKTYVMGLTTSAPGTIFTGFYSYAKSWFSAIGPGEERRNVMCIITDGAPDPMDQFSVALAEGAPLINQTGTWSGNNAVDIYGVNIDLGNTDYTEQLENTPNDGVPVVDGSSSDELYNAIFFAFMGDSPAMNVIHAVRECLTDPDWGMGYLESDLDDASFRAAALKLRSERLGVCMLWDRQKPIEDMVNEFLKHANAALFVDRKTGLFRIKLIRDDYTVGSLLHLDETHIQKIDNFKRPTFGELTTSVTVNYWNVTTGSNSSVTADDIALAAMQGAPVKTTLQFVGLPDAAMAGRVAMLNLKVLSGQYATCDVYADRTAADLVIGDCFRCTWPEYGFDQTVMRVTNIAYGDGKSNRVKITCIEDAFALPTVSPVVPSDPIWENPAQPPQPVTRQYGFEAPYLELVQRQGNTVVDALLASNPDAGYVGAAGISPGGSVINARLYVDDNDGLGYEDVGLADFAPGGTLAVPVDRMATTFQLQDTVNLSTVTLGTWAQIGDEIVSIETVTGNNVTVKRGVLDTVPAEHAVGAHLLCWDEFSTLEDTEYASGETLHLKITPVSGSGEVSLAAATDMPVTLVGRAAKPYPPGRFKINGEYFPTLEWVGDLVVSWVHRNRLQQTGGVLIGFTDGTITTEAGVTYTIEVRDNLTNTVITTVTGITAESYTFLAADTSAWGSSVKITLWSVRDGLPSFQTHAWITPHQSGVVIITQNFSGYAAGSAPSGWSFPWRLPATRVIEARTGASGTPAQVFHMKGIAGSGRSAAQWDGAWASADSEMLTVVELSGSPAASVVAANTHRISGAAATENGIAASINFISATEKFIQATMYNAGVSSSLACRSKYVDGALAGFYAIKTRLKGDLLLMKAWRLTALNVDPALTEPPEWLHGTRLPSTHLTGNNVGLQAFDASTEVYWDRINLKDPAAIRDLEVAGHTETLFTTGTSVVLTLPQCKVGDMIVLTVMRRAALTNSMAGWTLARSETSTESSGPTQWVDIYYKVATSAEANVLNDAAKTITFTVGTSGRLQAAAHVLTAPNGGTISLESATGSVTSLAPNVLNTLTPPSLVAASAGTVAVLACSVGLATTTLPAGFSINAPWVQLGQRVSTTAADQNRQVVGVRHLANGENINSSGPCYTNAMSEATAYYWMQAAAIFKVTP